MKFSQQSQKTFHKGFTLIETLFAILIFSAALVSLLAIAGKGISATSLTKSEITAYYLAQEGVEVARNARDTVFASGVGAWDEAFATNANCASGCYVDFSAGFPQLSEVTNATDDELFFASGIYTNQGGDPTGFRRQVTITPVLAGSTVDEYLVASTVSWNYKGITRTVELTTILKKWQ